MARAAGCVIWPPLPRMVRLGLWFHRIVDGTGYWLVCHDRSRQAIWLWKLTGGWE